MRLLGMEEMARLPNKDDRFFLKHFLLPAVLILVGLIIVRPWLRDGYPAEAGSVEPSIIALARFISQNWPKTAWCPVWYLGFPFRLAGSLLLPCLLAFLKFLFPALSFWLIYRLITGLALTVMPVGVYFLALFLIPEFGFESSSQRSDLKPLRSSPFLAALIFALIPSVFFLFPQVFSFGRDFGFWPWQYFSLAYLGNGTKILGLAILPFTLLTFCRFLKGLVKSPFPAIVLISLLALVDLSCLVSLLVLWTLLLVSYSLAGKLKDKFRASILLWLGAFGVLAFFYPLRFWWQVLMAPSLAGKRALSVGFLLTRTGSILFALILGSLMSARGKKKINQPSFIFVFLWTASFAFLSLARFIADFDFWQDYTGWGVEFQMGLSLLAGQIIGRTGESVKSANRNSRAAIRNSRFKTGIIFVTLISLLLYLSSRKKLLIPRSDIKETVEIKIVNWLEENVSDNQRVFLSGSPVFWLNAFSDKNQIRGGADKAANHPFWDHAAYQIRVGESPDLAFQWLQALGVSWLVVHDSFSKEVYHDFVRPEKFADNNRFLKFFADGGDYLYQVKAAGIVRSISDPVAFLKVGPPSDGADQVALSAYNSFLGDSLAFDFLNPGHLRIKPQLDKRAISLAIAFDPGWQARQKEEKIKIQKDALGQLIIFPEYSDQPIELEYAPPIWDSFSGLIGGISAILAMFFLRKKSFNLS